MFFQNRRVEEELERIRKANLPPERTDEGGADELGSIDAGDTDELGSIDAAETDGLETPDAAVTGEVVDFESLGSEVIDQPSKPDLSDDLRLTTKDIIAMIIAAFSIIIPYALLFIGIAVLFIFLFFAR